MNSFLIYSQLIFDKGTKNTPGERTLSSIIGVAKIGYPHAETSHWTQIQKSTQNGSNT